MWTHENFAFVDAKTQCTATTGKGDAYSWKYLSSFPGGITTQKPSQGKAFAKAYQVFVYATPLSFFTSAMSLGTTSKASPTMP